MDSEDGPFNAWVRSEKPLIVSETPVEMTVSTGPGPDLDLTPVVTEPDDEERADQEVINGVVDATAVLDAVPSFTPQVLYAFCTDVAQNAHEAAAVAATAVRVAGEANATIRQLGESSEQIDNVIRVINSIAEQTNILALNAEIEAARAGEAGKGFAVVANEVKELAKETARATEDIGRRVSAIRGDSRAAVAAISEIGKIIEQISSTQSAIAASVQQQSAATAEITRNMGEAARGTDEIAATISSVARATENTSAAARETQKAASELAMMATELQRTVSQFRFGMRTVPGGKAREPRQTPELRLVRGPVAAAAPDRKAA